MTPGTYRDIQNNRSCQSSCSFSPAKYYGDQTTWMCVLDCPTYPQYYYAYDPDKICRTDCPGNWTRDPLTRKCVSTCPNNTFLIVILIPVFKNAQLRIVQGRLTMGMQLTQYQSALLIPIALITLMQMIKLGCVLMHALIINGNMEKDA